MSDSPDTRDVSRDRSPSEQVDLCIVGAGVAGGLVAKTVSEQGYDVVILEAGKRFDPERRLERMETALRPDIDRNVWGMGGERDRFAASGDVDYPLNRTRVKGVGGTTLHWAGYTPRFHPKDFEMESRYGLATDWPIDYADLKPYYAAAERELGVTGAEDNPFAPPRDESYPMEAFPRSYSDTLFEAACEELGIETHSAPQARNSTEYDGRSQCVGYSTCVPVCPSGAKYSGDVHVRKAEQHGTRVIDRAAVQRLEHDRDGERVTAAVYTTPDGLTHRQEARQFVVACGGVETPRLLLLSRSETYPDGLANTSGLVGRYFMDHPMVFVRGRLDQPTNQNPIFYNTMTSHQFYDHDGPVPGSIKLDFRNTGPSPPHVPAVRGGDRGTREDLLDPLLGDSWGDDLLEAVREQHVENEVRMSAYVEKLPRREDRIGLDTSQTDDQGNPVPDVSLGFGSHARETMARAVEIMRDVLREMGAEITVEFGPDSPAVAAHHMGTTRMGTSPEQSVVNPHLRTHDLDNLWLVSGSAFVTGGAMNPTLTIAALALRTAQRVAKILS